MGKYSKYFIKGYQLYLEKLISFSLGLYLFGFLINGLTPLKYIGLITSALLFIFYFIKNYNFVIETYKNYLLNNKMLFMLFFLFIISILISIIFAFSNSLPSLKEFRITFVNISIFMIIASGIQNKTLKKTIFYSIIYAFMFDIYIFAFHYIQKNPHLNFSIRLNRLFANYFEILYPFILISFFLLKNKWAKITILLFLIFGFFELVLTGSRGAWITVLIETILFAFYLILIEKKYLKKIIIYSFATITSFLLIFIYIYNHSSLIQYKFKQGLNPNGRYKIIQTRLPIFLKHGNFLTGIGGPNNYQYNKFLNYYKAPQILGIKSEKKFHYFSDEPFLLQIFYKEGILGLITFLLFSFYFIWIGYKTIFSNSNKLNKFVISTIIISFIGEYFIRGLVEGRSLKYLIFFLTLFIIFNHSKENNENSLYLS